MLGGRAQANIQALTVNAAEGPGQQKGSFQPIFPASQKALPPSGGTFPTE